jgi:rhodanese-related sulfurtransferase
MSLRTIAPEAARELMRQGAVLIDVRGADEHARERIPAARHLPLERLGAEALPAGIPAVIFHCRSGNRTRLHGERLAAGALGCEAYVLEGGLDGWKKAGLPVAKDASQPIELQRQVQIAAGSMTLAGTVLGVAVSPWFFVVPAFFGAGLTFAGLTGFCGLARVLMKMPWNRRALSA